MRSVGGWLALPVFLASVAVASLGVASAAESSSPKNAENAAWGVARKLLRPDTLDGWGYGAKTPSGWTVRSGRLTGAAGSTDLLSGFTMGDFELQFSWAASKSDLTLVFPTVPRGPELTLTLREGDRAVELLDDGKPVLNGEPLAIASADVHTARVVRRGESFAVEVDGRPAGRASLAAERRFGLGVKGIAQGNGASVGEFVLREAVGEPLFNGKDLSEFWTPGELSAWGVEDGRIVWKKSGGNYLRSRRQYGNFTLSLDYKISRGGNSGVGIRTAPEGWPSSCGMEIQVYDLPRNAPMDRHMITAIYGNMPPLARADRSGEWNSLVIKAEGRMISCWINGELTQQADTADHPELKNRFLKGWIGFQDHDAAIQVRNPRVAVAPDGLGLDAWRVARPLRGGPAIFDRLMNPELTIVDDGIRRGAVSTQVADAGGKDGGKSGNGGERVLADLQGPGAIVRIAKNVDAGRLAFYFDEETKPRILCKPSALREALVHLCDDVDPLTTYVPYAKRLKIVWQDASQGRFRFDYVTFPAKYAVTSYRGGGRELPRGWSEAVLYRSEIYGWGSYRDFPFGRQVASQPKTLQPGQSETMIAADGAGLIRWFKVQRDKPSGADKDLWIEAYVDGEAKPAVAAPLRFWFPGLYGKGNYPNYVALERGGLILTLPMPYGRGIRIAAVNRGKRPIEGLHMAACVDDSPEQQRPGPMRLRGVYYEAGREPGTLVRAEGVGRWIGFVCESAGKTPVPITALNVDGRDASGWESPDLAMLLGREGGDFRSTLSGRAGNLSWRYLLLDPVDYRQSLSLKTSAKQLGPRFALFYGAK